MTKKFVKGEEGNLKPDAIPPGSGYKAPVTNPGFNLKLKPKVPPN